MTALMFYRRPVRLDRKLHADLRLRPSTDFGFARKVNSVMLLGAEFAEAQRHFPIVFVEVAAGQLFPAALLGVRANENLFVDDTGAWAEGRYIPAFVRRYPFVVTPELDVCIDEESPALSREEGEPLFLDDGAESPTLKRASAFLAQFQEEVRRTQAFTTELQSLGLLKPWTVQIALAGAAPYRIDGLHVIDDARSSELTDERIAAWFRSGDLARLQAHLFSLQNLGALTARAHSSAALSGDEPSLTDAFLKAGKSPKVASRRRAKAE